MFRKNTHTYTQRRNDAALSAVVHPGALFCIELSYPSQGLNCGFVLPCIRTEAASAAALQSFTGSGAWPCRRARRQRWLARGAAYRMLCPCHTAARHTTAAAGGSHLRRPPCRGRRNHPPLAALPAFFDTSSLPLSLLDGAPSHALPSLCCAAVAAAWAATRLSHGRLHAVAPPPPARATQQQAAPSDSGAAAAEPSPVASAFDALATTASLESGGDAAAAAPAGRRGEAPAPRSRGGQAGHAAVSLTGGAAAALGDAWRGFARSLLPPPPSPRLPFAPPFVRALSPPPLSIFSPSPPQLSPPPPPAFALAVRAPPSASQTSPPAELPRLLLQALSPRHRAALLRCCVDALRRCVEEEAGAEAQTAAASSTDASEPSTVVVAAAAFDAPNLAARVTSNAARRAGLAWMGPLQRDVNTAAGATSTDISALGGSPEFDAERVVDANDVRALEASLADAAEDALAPDRLGGRGGLYTSLVRSLCASPVPSHPTPVPPFGVPQSVPLSRAAAALSSAVLQDLVVTVAEAVAAVYVARARGEAPGFENTPASSSASSAASAAATASLLPQPPPPRAALLPPLRRTRSLERFRNEVSLRRWAEARFLSIRSAAQDEQLLLGFGPAGALTTKTVPCDRRAELDGLTGWRAAVARALEAADVAGPLLKRAAAALGDALAFLLVRLIGRGLGLVARGVRSALSGT